jgi:hypothetical protein
MIRLRNRDMAFNREMRLGPVGRIIDPPCLQGADVISILEQTWNAEHS